jgi:glycosyltransferase involved in cell wall biosynthesis
MAGFIEQTILSVINQQYPNLEYIIIDGGSTDGTVDIIKKYESSLHYWVSEPDKGMYHAIQKGFDNSTGEIMGWINSDDMLHPKSLFLLAKCFSKPEVNWVQGLNTVMNEEGFVIATCKPYNTNVYNFLCSEHLKNNQIKSFGTVQQESTYWRRSLWNKVKGLNLKYKYAGDFALWMTFFRHEQMYFVDSLIGAFRVRSEQISSKRKMEYIEETRHCIKQELDQLDSFEHKRVKKYILYNKLNLPLIKKILMRLDNEYREHVKSKGIYLTMNAK